jgi:hypothetical protein
MAYPQASFNATSEKSSKDLKKELIPERRDREKGLWNFLVWSLFLSQMMTADGALASGAHAATDDAGSEHGHSIHDATADTSALPGPVVMGLLGAGDDEPGDSAQNTGLASSVTAQTLLSHVPGHDVAKLAAIDANKLVHETDAGPAVEATSAAPAETAQSVPDDGTGQAGDVGLPNPGDLIGDLGNGVSDVVGDVVQGTVVTLTGTLGDLGDTVQTIVDNPAGPILSDVGGLVQSLGNTLGNPVQSLVTETVTPVLADVGGLIQSLGDTLDDTVQSLVTDTVTPVLADAGGLVQSLGDGLGQLADIGLVLDPGQVLGGLGNGLTQATDLITQLPFAETLGGVGETLQSLVTDGAGVLVSEIGGLAQPLGDTLGQLADVGLSLDADGTLGSLGHGISDLLGDTAGSVQAPMAGMLDATVQTLTAPVGNVLAPVLADASDLVEPVGDVAAQALPQVSALLDGVDGLAQNAGQSILADSGLDGTQNLGGLLGAAHAGADTGNPITISALLDGVGDAIEPVVSTVNSADMASSLQGSLTGVLDGILASGGSLALNPPVLGNAAIDDLFNTGGYTNYNLSFQTEVQDTINPLPGVGSVGTDTASLLDQILGQPNHVDPSAGGHETSHTQIVGLPSAIEDLLTRGHGDLL